MASARKPPFAIPKIDPASPHAREAHEAQAHLEARGVDPATIAAVIAKILAGMPAFLALLQAFLKPTPAPPAAK